ncbi:cell wall protein RBR3-like [Limulus polyphemus]|uniref:Cell wall protein RBR3-like n=1 Tax=Limulus polyphemus TaxID=6850 RepID=A0ABM1S2K0_LIMPO|nr:cell wall protein RBR3-like [Limulus polyphemus]
MTTFKGGDSPMMKLAETKNTGFNPRSPADTVYDCNTPTGHPVVNAKDNAAAGEAYVLSRAKGEDVSAVEVEDLEIKGALPTITVRGFLNFRTTVDNTVIVFTPAKSDNTDNLPSSSRTTPSSSLATTVTDNTENSEIQDLEYTQTPGIFISGQDLENAVKDSYSPKPGHNLVPSLDDAYTGLSQRFTPERSKKVHSSSTQVTSTVAQHSTPSLPQYPTGLVTVLTEKTILSETTIFYETSVIGTFIDGKYAQILKSTSQTSSSSSSSSKHSTTVRSDVKPSPSKVLQLTPSGATLVVNNSTSQLTSSKPISTTESHQLVEHAEIRQNNFDRKKGYDDVSNTDLQSSFKFLNADPEQSRSPTQILEARRSSTSSRQKFHLTSSKDISEKNTLLSVRSLRRPTERFRYVPRQRNTHTVQLNRFKVKLNSRPDELLEEDNLATDEEKETEKDENGADDGTLISVDPARVIYELATITSEVTLHVGRRKSVRTLTITTSLQRTLEPSELASYELDASEVADRNKAIVSTDGSSYYVISRTYSITEHTLRTSLVPALNVEYTTMHTVTESFFIRKIITAYRTLPANDFFLLKETLESDVGQFFNSSVEDDFQDDTFPLQSTSQQQMFQTPLPNSPLLQTSNLDSSMLSLLSSRNLPLQISNPLLSIGAALNQNPLAAMYLGLQQLNRQVTMYSTVTKATSYVTTDTVYSTKVIRFYDGRITRSRTLSESLSTKIRTITTLTTAVQPIINNQAAQQQKQLQQLIGTKLQYSIVTSSYTTITTATSTSTRIYTLIYNAFSTKYRTVTSTSPYETTITTYSTSEIPISATTQPSGGSQYYK